MKKRYRKFAYSFLAVLSTWLFYGIIYGQAFCCDHILGVEEKPEELWR